MKKFYLIFGVLLPLFFSCQKIEKEGFETNNIIQLRSSVNAGILKYSTKKDCLRGKGDCMVGIGVGPNDLYFPISLSILDEDDIKIDYLTSNFESEDGIYLSLGNDINLPSVLSNSLQKNSLVIKAGTYTIQYNENEFGSVIVKYE
jgi:hypothetical protein